MIIKAGFNRLSIIQHPLARFFPGFLKTFESQNK